MKLLALDLGNSTLFAGFFRNGKLVRSIRIAASPTLQGDDVLEEKLTRLIQGKVNDVALCSVVPKQMDRLAAWVKKTFGLDALILTPLADHGLKIEYRRPKELGADRLATVLGAQKLYPGKNVIVVDCGTATTLTLLRRDGCLLGGTIMPGLGLWSGALAQSTAQLPEVALQKPRRVVGRDTETALRSGSLHGHMGAIRELVKLSRAEAFGRSPVAVLGTGGWVTHFKTQSLFTAVEPALILHGLQAFAVRNYHHA